MKRTFDNLPEDVATLIDRVASLEALLKELLARQQVPENNTEEIPNLMTVDELMEIYGVGKTTVYKWFKNGLQITKMGRKTFIKRSHLKQFEKLNNQFTSLKKSL